RLGLAGSLGPFAKSQPLASARGAGRRDLLHRLRGRLIGLDARLVPRPAAAPASRFLDDGAPQPDAHVLGDLSEVPFPGFLQPTQQAGVFAVALIKSDPTVADGLTRAPPPPPRQLRLC